MQRYLIKFNHVYLQEIIINDMLSKNQIKLIVSLQKKKFRDQHQLFVAEGEKLVVDLLNAGMHAAFLIHTPQWENSATTKNIELEIIDSPAQIKKISSLKTPPQVVAVFKIPDMRISPEAIKNSLSLLLDDIQDPGNMGTIIRIADWFGISQIFCSPNTVDVFNPKVIQATMGAIARVNIIYTPLSSLIEDYKDADFPVYGTFLDGENIYQSQLQNKGFIVMGNEGKGVSNAIAEQVSNRLFIPNYPAEQTTSESLNVAVATAVVCAEFRRR